MQKKYKFTRRFLLGFLIMSLILFSQDIQAKEASNKVVFSWKTDAVNKGGQELFELLESVGANVVYQNISADTKNKTIKKFLKNAYKRDISVYLLVGQPDWVLDDDKAPYMEEVKRIEKYNKLVKQKETIKGIVFDVEPYTIEEWDIQKEVLMENYLSAMKNTYKEAKKKKISMVACIPYFYEELGMKAELKDLMKNACDEVAVMNYYRGKEIKHIKTEAKYALKYGKKLINIYEFQPSGTHGLIEQNTYYDLGLKAAEKNFKKMKKKYKKQDISMGLHDAETLKKLVQESH